MLLSTGTRLGSYEIVAALGAGGMGEVYRARDMKLGRDVAIEVLSEVFAADAERLARFQREAQLLAALNHPNIAAIYGLEDAPSTSSGQAGAARFIVMELVEGGVHVSVREIDAVVCGRVRDAAGERPFDVSRDGQRFLMIKEPPPTDSKAPAPMVVVVTDWFEELRQRVAAK